MGDAAASPKTLYHATISTFDDGQVLTHPRAGTYYPEVAEVLDCARPGGAPSRAACYFACETIEFAVAHLEAVQQTTKTSAPINLYAVEILGGWRSPVVLVAKIAKGMTQGRDIGSMVSEYWIPQREWRFFEVFGAQMTVLRTVSFPDRGAVGVVKTRYQFAEMDTAEQMLLECPHK